MAEDIAVVSNPARNRFEINLDGHTAYAEYELAGGVMTFTHTVVPEALGGRGLSKVLAKGALESARERGLRVIPVCSVFDKYIHDNPAEQDLLGN